MKTCFCHGLVALDGRRASDSVVAEEVEQLLAFARRRDLRSFSTAMTGVISGGESSRYASFSSLTASLATRAALHAFELRLRTLAGLPSSREVRRHVFQQLAVAADERHLSDAHELVDADHAADVRAVLDGDVSGELARVRHDDEVRRSGSCARCARRRAAGCRRRSTVCESPRRAAMDRDEFADDVAVADADVATISPLNFLSCDVAPITANGWIWRCACRWSCGR